MPSATTERVLVTLLGVIFVSSITALVYELFTMPPTHQTAEVQLRN